MHTGFNYVKKKEKTTDMARDGIIVFFQCLVIIRCRWISLNMGTLSNWPRRSIDTSCFTPDCERRSCALVWRFFLSRFFLSFRSRNSTREEKKKRVNCFRRIVCVSTIRTLLPSFLGGGSRAHDFQTAMSKTAWQYITTSTTALNHKPQHNVCEHPRRMCPWP